MAIVAFRTAEETARQAVNQATLSRACASEMEALYDEAVYNEALSKERFDHRILTFPGLERFIKNRMIFNANLKTFKQSKRSNILRFVCFGQIIFKIRDLKSNMTAQYEANTLMSAELQVYYSLDWVLFVSLLVLNFRIQLKR